MKNKSGTEETKPRHRRGLTRRRFLKTMGSGAAIAAIQDTLTSFSTAEAEVIRPETVVRVELLVNGLRRRLAVEPRWSLLYVLRDKLGLTGTTVGCERGECGACTVLIEGIPRYACMTLAVEAGGPGSPPWKASWMERNWDRFSRLFLSEMPFSAATAPRGRS